MVYKVLKKPAAIEAFMKIIDYQLASRQRQERA
jgi:hypothetical protein